MKILSFTAGAASMYCGSCLRDNALAAELTAQGHDVTLLPLYTPTRTDEPNVSREKVLFGGISVYLEQNSALFRSMPRVFDRLLDSSTALKAAARRSISVNPSFLAEMTISMLKGEEGRQRKEFSKLLEWLATQPAPEIVNLPNSLLLALARPLKKALRCPVVVTMQGEDSFLAGLPDIYAREALDMMRALVAEADAFVAVSGYYGDFMADYLRIPQEKLHVVPLGVNPKGTAPRSRTAVFTIGYFARVARQKGLKTLCEAYRHLRRELGLPPSRLEVAGYLGPEFKGYLSECEDILRKAGLSGEFHYHGELDRADKIQFLRKLDVFSVPAEAEPKGLSVLEAMANGVPVVQPSSGTFPEMIEKTSGGLLCKPGKYESLAEGIFSLWKDPSRGEEIGRRGAEGVRRHYTVARMAERTIEVYQGLVEAKEHQTREA